MRITTIVSLTALTFAAGCFKPGSEIDGCSWTQHGGSASHQGRVACAAAKSPARILGDVMHDPFVELERDDFGSLRIHYQAPLIAGDDVYLQQKRGEYTPCVDSELGERIPCGPEHFATQIWGEVLHRWVDGQLQEQWYYATDWKPVPYLGTEQMFHGALHGDTLWVPGFAGAMHQVNRHTGTLERRFDPFASDPSAYIAGPPAVARDGTLYYTVMLLNPDDPFFSDATGVLVKIGTGGEVTTATFAELIPNAPAATDLCYRLFPNNIGALPPPPQEDGSPTLPPEAQCMSQRPALNAAPAIASDGTVYFVSRAHNADAYTFLVAVSSNLEPKWATSLRDHLDDGCGVRARCRDGALLGVDPSTNLKPAGRAIDSSTSSPVVLPDGAVLYGAYTGYNGSRGHLMKFSSAGAYLASYDFGWDITPGVWEHGLTYSIVVKDNHYANNPALERFYITQLDPNLVPEWTFRATNNENCSRQEDGSIACITESENGYEWCINAPAIDSQGTVHVASEDGNIYAIGQGGIEKGRHFMHLALRSGYTPVALDGQGRIYGMNYGHVTVVGE